jgi:hypothetical protein
MPLARMLVHPLPFANRPMMSNDRQEYYADNDVTYMHAMINGGRFILDDCLGTEGII